MRHHFTSCLSLLLFLGLQSRFIGLDKLAKLGSVREQRVPLLQVERDREATETVYRNSPLLGHFEAKAAALGDAVSTSLRRRPQRTPNVDRASVGNGRTASRIRLRVALLATDEMAEAIVSGRVDVLVGEPLAARGESL